jgi:general stress protein YciG
MANQGNQSGSNNQSGGNRSGGSQSGGKQSGGDNQSGAKSRENDSESKRGFAAMDKDEQRNIAKKGGESVPDEERSFSKDRDLASEAGKKGGEARSESSGNSKR